MKTNKLVINLLLVILMGFIANLASGCWAIPEDRSTGNFIKEERNVSNFNRLNIGGAFKVFLAQGDQEKIVIEADADEMKDIKTEVTGNTLKIYTDSQWSSRYHEMTIWLTFKNIEKIDFSGAVEVESQGMLNFSELDMDISGASEINLDMKAEKIDAEFSGASEIDFSGTCTTGYFELSGASEFDAEELQFQDLSIEVSGASDAKVWANGKLTINASGASDIRYKGTPNISIDQSGASSVKPF